MGFWRRLFGRKKNIEAEEASEPEQYDWDQVNLREKDINLQDAGQRTKYVRFLLERIADAESTISSLTSEYGVLTSYLKDMEEIDALPEEEKKELLEYAGRIQTLEQDRLMAPERESLIPEEQYRRMERMESEISEGIRKIREAEDYRVLVKKDLRRLDAERQAYEIRQQELGRMLDNSKGTSIICICAMCVCIAGLLVFQFGLDMDTRIGYLLIGILTAVVLTYAFLHYHDMANELNKVENSVRKLILLQNRVKIRYVNNTNLLDYLYMKYMTGSADEMEKQYQLFLQEREERESYVKLLDDMSFYQKELLRILRRYQLYDPTIWIHQTQALTNPREMVEIRHEYIGQRQKLRKQMERNQELADESKVEIKRIVENYPAYAKEILAIVDEYDTK